MQCTPGKFKIAINEHMINNRSLSHERNDIPGIIRKMSLRRLSGTSRSGRGKARDARSGLHYFDKEAQECMRFARMIYLVQECVLRTTVLNTSGVSSTG